MIKNSGGGSRRSKPSPGPFWGSVCGGGGCSTGPTPLKLAPILFPGDSGTFRYSVSVCAHACVTIQKWDLTTNAIFKFTFFNSVIC